LRLTYDSIVYHCFSEVMGISPKVVQEHHDAFDNMLGLFHGRVYYNLKNWYRLVRMFPGYHYNRRFMESMMGVRESARFDDTEPPPPGWRQRYFVELPALLRLATRFFLAGAVPLTHLTRPAGALRRTHHAERSSFRVAFQSPSGWL